MALAGDDKDIAEQADSVKMTDGETFESAFAKDEPPAKAAEPEADKAFVAEVEAKRADKPETFKQAFARNMKDPDVVKAGKFQWTNPKTGKTTWYKAAYDGGAKAKPAAKAPALDKVSLTKPVELTKGVVKAEPKPRPSVYADNFIKDGINKIKSKMDEKGSSEKTLVNGKRNLTAE